MYNQNSLSVYPNPNNGKFTIDIDNNYKGNITIVIFAVFGTESKIIKVEKTMNNMKCAVDLISFSPGSYFIDVLMSSHRISQIIIIN